MNIPTITQQELRQFHKLKEGEKELKALNESIKTRLAIGTEVEPGHFTARLDPRWTTPDWKEAAFEQIIAAFGEPAKVIMANAKTLAEHNKKPTHMLKVDYKTTKR